MSTGIVGTVRFRNWTDCDVVMAHYAEGNPALVLMQGEERIAVASLNLDPGVVEDGEIAIKDYSENEGMLDVLVAAGIVSAPIRHEQTGYIDTPICKLLVSRGEPAAA